MKDKYQYERFSFTCPTCGQKFLKEELEQKIEIIRQLKDLVKSLEKQLNLTKLIETK